MIRIAVLHCGDTMFTGECAPTDRHVVTISTWEELLALMSKPLPPDMAYPHGKSKNDPEMQAYSNHIATFREVEGPKRAVLAVLASGSFADGTVCYSGAVGEKDYGYYGVVEQSM